MIASKTSPFYKIYRKNNIHEYYEYLRRASNPGVPDHGPLITRTLDKKQSGTIYESHEATIFKKYAELGSCSKVAEYYAIPMQHVKEVVRKVKDELKEKIKQCA